MTSNQRVLTETPRAYRIEGALKQGNVKHEAVVGSSSCLVGKYLGSQVRETRGNVKRQMLRDWRRRHQNSIILWGFNFVKEENVLYLTTIMLIL